MVKSLVLENISVVKETIDEAWLSWYNLFKENNISIKSRDGYVIAECVNAITVIKDPTKNIMTNDIRKLSMRYAIGEMLWYMSANPSLRAIQHYTKAWDRMSDDGKTVNSNYGYCIREKFGFDQLDYVIEMLSKYPDSRRAVIHIKEPRNTFEKPTNDMNCTVCLQFFIREGKLYETVYMRSNDIWYGLPYDALFFTSIQIYLAMKLGVKLGTYTHVAGSLHLYERNADKC